MNSADIFPTCYKEFCIKNRVRNTTIPKDKFASLLKATLENNFVNNAQNV
jgi:hypothetical protein